MTKNYFFGIYATLFLLVSQATFAQYQVKSQFINNPELLIDYVNDCASFWEGVHDDTYGGFFVEVGKTGNILDNNKKSLVSESRDAYGFARAFMLTGNTDYLNYSHSALQFMYDHLWDAQYGGWFRRCNRAGSSPYTGVKTTFDQHYALLGITAYYEATNSSADKQMLDNGYNYIEENLWDNSLTYFGYYDQVNRDGSQAKNKSFNATVDAITTHLYNLYLITNEVKYRDRLLEMESNIQEYFIPSLENQEIGFAELYNSIWMENSGEKRTIMGHVLKTGWCMGRIYQINKDQNTLNAAKSFVQNVLDKGYDHEYGGPYKDYDRTTGEMYMYGAQDTAKAWWQMEQAVTAGFLLYEITTQDKYLKMADESLDFFMNYFVDPTYGEIYADRNREGGRVPGWDENKGSEWKAAYHSIETAYYSYLYSKLLIKKETATLYYQFDPVSEDRILNMNPLAMDFDKLKINNVLLNGSAYANYNPDDRTLTIPSGTGGVFAVSYKLTSSPYGVDENKFSNIAKVYPNPSHGKVNIEFKLSTTAYVEISVYNSMGQKVDMLQNGISNSGHHKIMMHNYKSKGLYYIVLLIDGQRYVNKVLLN